MAVGYRLTQATDCALGQFGIRNEISPNWGGFSRVARDSVSAMSGAWQISASTATILRLDGELLRFFRKQVLNVEDAKDLASTTWLGAGRNFKHLSSLRYFMFAVAAKVLAQHKRRALRRPPSDAAEVESLASGALTMESVVDLLDREDTVEQAVMQVPEFYQPIVRLWLTGQDGKTIADELGINYNTARARLSRGRQYFYRALS